MQWFGTKISFVCMISQAARTNKFTRDQVDFKRALITNTAAATPAPSTAVRTGAQQKRTRTSGTGSGSGNGSGSGSGSGGSNTAGGSGVTFVGEDTVKDRIMKEFFQGSARQGVSGTDT